MQKILILNGSIRKKSTYFLLKKIQKEFDNYSVEFININDYNIKPCIGCEKCILNGTCNLKDDTKIILDKMVESDGIIIGTPVYLRHLSGLVKVLLDRGCSWYHRSPLVGKPIIFASTTQVTGSKETMKYLMDLSLQWGTINVGNISRTMFNLDKDLETKIINRFKFYLPDSSKLNYKPSLKQIIEFNTQKVLAVNIIPLDKKYWENKGIINSPYFYSCKINFLKKLFGLLYYKMLSYFIKKIKS